VDRYRIIGDEASIIPFCSLEATQSLLEFYGCAISTTLHSLVTHVVMDKSDKTRLTEIRAQLSRVFQDPPHRAKYVVSKAWVEESVNQHEDLDEREFLV